MNKNYAVVAFACLCPNVASLLTLLQLKLVIICGDDSTIRRSERNKIEDILTSSQRFLK